MLNFVYFAKLIGFLEAVGLGFVAISAGDCQFVAEEHKKHELRSLGQNSKPLAFEFNLRHGESLTLELSGAGGVRLERVVRRSHAERTIPATSKNSVRSTLPTMETCSDDKG